MARHHVKVSLFWQAVILLLLVAVSYFFAVRQYIQTERLLTEAIEAEGLVVALTPFISHGYPNENKLAPTISFYVQDGKEHQFTSDIFSNPPKYALNEKLTVLYPAGRPEEARIKDIRNLWLPTMALAGFGTIALLNLVYVIRKMGNSKKT